jgi:uncharacterized protein with NAD-binding domain and iron-sulfur cluster
MKSASINAWVENIPHVAIVGAGIAGLSCAKYLLDCGVRVTILEARKVVIQQCSINRVCSLMCCLQRIGGRIHSCRDLGDGLIVDLGAGE